MKKIRKEDFAILNESEMNETKGGIRVEKPIGFCGKEEFIFCYANYKIDIPTLPYDREVLLEP
ncbi:MAG: hypothetical protein IK003_05595 [Prevotella sp.]|nr:hypothetical protein [Prevotella sp.]